MLVVGHLCPSGQTFHLSSQQVELRRLNAPKADADATLDFALWISGMLLFVQEAIVQLFPLMLGTCCAFLLGVSLSLSPQQDCSCPAPVSRSLSIVASWM